MIWSDDTFSPALRKHFISGLEYHKINQEKPDSSTASQTAGNCFKEKLNRKEKKLLAEAAFTIRKRPHLSSTHSKKHLKHETQRSILCYAKQEPTLHYLCQNSPQPWDRCIDTRGGSRARRHNSIWNMMRSTARRSNGKTNCETWELCW